MAKQVLIIGASRGIGFGLAKEFLDRGWDTTATVRSEEAAEKLRVLQPSEKLRVEFLDITKADQIAMLHDRLKGSNFDLVFVVAAIRRAEGDILPNTSLEEFQESMATNAYWPVRCVDTLLDLVTPDATLAFLTSGGGSFALNDEGGQECYRASKTALNMMVLNGSFRWGDGRTSLLIHPGWVRTDMGGAEGMLDISESARAVADVVEKRKGSRGTAFVNYDNTEIPW